MNADINTGWNEIAEKYDVQFRQLVPDIDNFYGTAVDILDFYLDEKPSVLDLGAGTGLLSSFVSSRFKNAEFTLVDLSEKMLGEAKKRFSGSDIKAEYIVADYGKYDFGKKYDAVVSALSIHHLSAEDKQKLFVRILGILREGGVFINVDKGLSQNDEINRLFKEQWIKDAYKAGASKETVDKSLKRQHDFDIVETLDNQLQWLNNAGFGDVECYYRKMRFVVYAGRKI